MISVLNFLGTFKHNCCAALIEIQTHYVHLGIIMHCVTGIYNITQIK